MLLAYPRDRLVYQEACLKGRQVGGFLQAYGCHFKPSDEDAPEYLLYQRFFGCKLLTYSFISQTFAQPRLQEQLCCEDEMSFTWQSAYTRPSAQHCFGVVCVVSRIDCQALGTRQDPKATKTGPCPLEFPAAWRTFPLEASKCPWGVTDVVQGKHREPGQPTGSSPRPQLLRLTPPPPQSLSFGKPPAGRTPPPGHP